MTKSSSQMRPRKKCIMKQLNPLSQVCIVDISLHIIEVREVVDSRVVWHFLKFSLGNSVSPMQMYYMMCPNTLITKGYSCEKYLNLSSTTNLCVLCFFRSTFKDRSICKFVASHWDSGG